MAFDLIYGYTGMLSFGQSLFFGVGAYGASLPIIYFGVNIWAALGIALITSLVISLVTGFFAVRVSGSYFIIITIIFSTVFYFMAFNLYWLTGGETGLSFKVPTLTFGAIEFSLYDPAVNYYFVLAMLIISYILLRRIVNSPLGRIFKAIRENEERARFVGYNVERYKLISFVIAGIFSGFSGALYTLMFRYTSASFLGLMISANPVIWTLIGGAGTLIGPILGTVLITIFIDSISSYIQNYLIIVGAVVIIMIILAPQGIVGLIRQRTSGMHGGISSRWMMRKQFSKPEN